MKKLLPFFGRCWFAVVMALGWMGAGCQMMPQSAQVFEHRETVLGPFDGNVEGPVNNSKSANGCRVAMVVRDGGKFRAVIDGVQGPAFDTIGVFEPSFDTFQFSSDGKHCAYIAHNGNNKVVVIDGVAGPEYDDIDDRGVIFSENGASIGYMARKQYHAFVVINGREYEKFDAVFDLTFSPDGRHWAYVVLSDDRNSYKLVVDEKVTPPLSGEATDLEYSSDGLHFAYLVAVKDNADKLFVDGIEQKELPDAYVESYQFSENGKHLAYAASKDDVGWVVKDGVPGPPYNQEFINFLFSTDGEHVAYLSREEDDWRLIVDGRKLERVNDFQLENFAAFAPDGHLAAYIAAKKTPIDYVGNMEYVIANGVAGPIFDGIVELTLSPDGRRIAYKTTDTRRLDDSIASITLPTEGHNRVVIDGQLQPMYPSVRHFKFSPDSKHFAYVAVSNESACVILDGVPQPRFSFAGPIVFSADSRRMAYVAGQPGHTFVMVNGSAGPDFQAILTGPVVCADGRLEYIALKGKDEQAKLVRVDVEGFSPPSVSGVMPSWSSKFAHDKWGE